MSSKSQITCPNCNHQFDIEDALGKQLEDTIRKKYFAKLKEEQNKLESEKNLLLQSIENEKKNLAEKETNIENSIAIRLKELQEKQARELQERIRTEFEAQLEAYKKQKNEDIEKIKSLQLTAIENEKLKQQLDTQKSELEIAFNKTYTEKLRETRENLEKKIAEENELKLKEKESLIAALQLQMQEMQRRAAQGSMQLQGEVQEVYIEEWLKERFIFDEISEVGKGVKGADIIQTVRNNRGAICGKIAWESKRTKHWGGDWVKKIKEDAAIVKADICVIVSEIVPEEIDKMGMIDGVWVCTFQDFKGMAVVLRDSLIRVQEAYVSQTNKGDKMQMLYDYLMGNEFKMHISAIINGFNSLKQGYEKEKLMMMKIWKEREKQLDHILVNTYEFGGSLQGIAGNSISGFELLESKTGE